MGMIYMYKQSEEQRTSYVTNECIKNKKRRVKWSAPRAITPCVLDGKMFSQHYMTGIRLITQGALVLIME